MGLRLAACDASGRFVMAVHDGWGKTGGKGQGRVEHKGWKNGQERAPAVYPFRTPDPGRAAAALASDPRPIGAATSDISSIWPKEGPIIVRSLHRDADGADQSSGATEEAAGDAGNTAASSADGVHRPLSERLPGTNARKYRPVTDRQAIPSRTSIRQASGVDAPPPRQHRWPVLLPLIPAALCLLALRVASADAAVAQMLLVGMASALAALSLLLYLRSARAARHETDLARQLVASHAKDPDAVIVTDRAGRLIAGNAAALGLGKPDTSVPAPADLVARHCAEPGRLIDSLRAKVLSIGHAQRHFPRNGEMVKLSVHAVQTGQRDRSAWPLLVWRLSLEGSGPPGDSGPPELPVLSIDADGETFAANQPLSALCDARAVAGANPGAEAGAGAESMADFCAGAAPVLETAPLRALAQQLVAWKTSAGPGGALRVMLGDRPFMAHALPPGDRSDGRMDFVFLPAQNPAAASLSGSGHASVSSTMFAAPMPGVATAGYARPGASAPARPMTFPGPVALTAFPDFEDIPVALMLIDAEGRIKRSNRLARGLLGIEPGTEPYFSELVEALGRPVVDWLADARAGRALNRPEVLRAIQPTQETFVQIILRRTPAAGAALFAVISDATELKSLEARFVQSQKMQAIGQLAGGVAHDFNNLLTAISGHCDLLLMNRDCYDTEYEDLMQIHQNANRAAALVRQLLAFSRKQTMKPEMLPLESLLEDLAHLLTRLVGERITLGLMHDRRLGPIWADRRQLEQVILNLVVNARDAMPMGGEIRIETRALTLEQDQDRGRARLPAGDYAVIEVRDEGIGIPVDNLDKIFEPFFTTKKLGEGTGLGLSTAYGIVKQMGGYIFAASTEGTGTVFSLYFATQTRGETQGDTLGHAAVTLELPSRPALAPGVVLRQAKGHGAPVPDAGEAGQVVDEGKSTGAAGRCLAEPVSAGREGLSDVGAAPKPGIDPKNRPNSASDTADSARWTESVSLPPDSKAEIAEETAPLASPAVAPGQAEPVVPMPTAGFGHAPRHDSNGGESNVRRDDEGGGGHLGGNGHGRANAAGNDRGRNGTRGRGMTGDGKAGHRDLGLTGREPDATVLLVEDEAPVRAFAARALRLQGYRVIEAESGEQALAFLQAEGIRVDIFVSDVVMPGLDGPGWVTRALAARPRTPVVFMSGYAEDSLSAALSRTAGAVFLDKPFTLNGLCQTIEQQLDRARAADHG